VKIRALGLLALGYVVGTRAGRERYEQRGDWRAKRRTASRSTAKVAPWPPGSSVTRPAGALAPDPASHLSVGVVVETRLIARLLGVRILRADGVVHIAPARLERPEPTAVEARRPVAADRQLGAGLARASRLLEDSDQRHD
jgi:hypothetical protein